MPATWIPFYSNNFNEILLYYSDFTLLSLPNELFSKKFLLITCIVFVVSCIPYKLLLKPLFIIEISEKEPYAIHVIKNNSEIKTILISIVGGSLLSLVLYYGIGTESEFMYQRF